MVICLWQISLHRHTNDAQEAFVLISQTCFRVGADVMSWREGMN